MREHFQELKRQIELPSTYPAGQKVNIGSFYQSQAIEVKGAGVSKTYVYIPNTL